MQTAEDASSTPATASTLPRWQFFESVWRWCVFDDRRARSRDAGWGGVLFRGSGGGRNSSAVLVLPREGPSLSAFERVIKQQDTVSPPTDRTKETTTTTTTTTTKQQQQQKVRNFLSSPLPGWSSSQPS